MTMIKCRQGADYNRAQILLHRLEERDNFTVEVKFEQKLETMEMYI